MKLIFCERAQRKGGKQNQAIVVLANEYHMLTCMNKGVMLYAGIAEVVTSMQEYCINREDLDFLIDVTKFKTKADWNEDPMKDIPPGVKSSFTRHAPFLLLFGDHFKGVMYDVAHDAGSA